MKKLLCLMLFCLLLNSTIYGGNKSGFMTADQKDALDGAASPSSSNVLATMDDVVAAEEVTAGTNITLSGDADNPIINVDIKEDVDMDSHVLQNLNEIKPAGSGLFIYPQAAEGDVWTNFAMFGATDTTYGRLLAAYGKTPGASKFIWMAHDGTDGKVVSGTGGLILKDASNEVTVENLTQVTQTLYVDGNRTDSYTESGHITKPYKTIQAAIAAASPQTTIHVGSGNYSGDITLTGNILCLIGNGVDSTSLTGNLIAGESIEQTLRDFRIFGTGSLTIVGNANVDNLRLYCGTVVSGIGSFLKCDRVIMTPKNSGVVPLTLSATGTAGVTLHRGWMEATGAISAIVQTGGTLSLIHYTVANTSAGNTTIESSGGVSHIRDTIVVNNGGGGAISLDNDGSASVPNALNLVVAAGDISCAAIPTYVESLNFILFGELSGSALIYKPASRINNDSSVSGATVKDALDTLLADSALIQHNDLLGKQGGSASEYYHITASQHGEIGNWQTATDKVEVDSGYWDLAKEISFCIPGDAYVTTKIAGILVGANLAGETISKVKIYADTAPTGASLIVDVNKNGTTIFTTQNKRPEIAIGANADDSDTPDVTALSEGDRLTIDIDQIGSTIAGGDFLYIAIIMTK